MSHLERRRNLWYATLTIPADARDRLGKSKFIQSLKTPDKREAMREAAPLLAMWRAMIAEARGQTDALTEEALRWKRHFSLQQRGADAGDGAYITGLEVLEDGLHERTLEIYEQKGESAANRFRSIAAGEAIATSQHYAAWKAQLSIAAKSKDQAAKDVESFVKHFPTIGDVSKAHIKKWLDEIGRTGKSIPTQKRILSACRSFWGYLDSHALVPPDLDPFRGVIKVSKGKAAGAKPGGGANRPYTPTEVVRLWEGARGRKVGRAKNAPCDTQLADLIMIGAYTGARIEELCSLKTSEITDESFRVTDSKTDAGHREVPIHSAIAPLVERLAESSTDGYLLSGLTFNKYGDRSNAIGKRFGRLKTSLGFSESYTFHSLRATFITQLENAGVSENLAADIVGHEKPRITYGLYSSGAYLEVMKQALELVSYPFPEATPTE